LTLLESKNTAAQKRKFLSFLFLCFFFPFETTFLLSRPTDTAKTPYNKASNKKGSFLSFPFSLSVKVLAFYLLFFCSAIHFDSFHRHYTIFCLSMCSIRICFFSLLLYSCFPDRSHFMNISAELCSKRKKGPSQ